MMAAFEDGGGKIIPLRQHFLLTLRLRVPGKQEAVLSKGKPQNDGIVVQVSVFAAVRPQYGQHRAVFIPQLRSRLGGGDGKPFVRDALQQIFIGLCGGHLTLRDAGHDDLPHIELLDDLRHTADMVGMRVRGNHQIERLRAQRAKLLHQLVLRRGRSRINQDILPARQPDQLAVRLTDVKIHHFKRALRHSLRGGRRGAPTHRKILPAEPQLPCARENRRRK